MGGPARGALVQTGPRVTPWSGFLSLCPRGRLTAREGPSPCAPPGLAWFLANGQGGGPVLMSRGTDRVGVHSRHKLSLVFLSQDVFTVSVGNLPPKAKVLIKITYITELSIQGAVAAFLMPATVAPWQRDRALSENIQVRVLNVRFPEPSWV